MPAREEIERLFEHAAGLDPSGRSAFLDRACAGDAGLRREVECLLALEEEAKDFLERPALDLEAGSEAHPETEAALLPGTLVGPYRVTAKVGSGGMGVVYKAHDTRLKRDVALKFLPRRFSGDPQAIERFQREARAASALNHPNICSIYDIGERDRQPFLVMELLEGQTLKQRLAQGPVPAADLVSIALQAASALEAAHAKGIVHRDIKPANLFVSSGAIVKIVDFGLAKLLSEPRRSAEEAGGGPAPAGEETITKLGTAMGTVAYMSPEQARGEAVDARSDLFSFGVTLYHMATGALPFQGGTPGARLEAILTQSPAPPRACNPAVAPELERIILKALEKDRAARYQAAAELRADLERLRPAPRRLARWSLAVAAALLLALGVTLAGVRLGWFGTQSPTLELTQRKVTANPAGDPVIRGSISPDGQSVAYADLAGIHVRRIDTGETRSFPAPEDSCFR
ncbi:MAG: serine/threonine protein kinase [Acidobacteria bacterium]|nr:serine/threonine protein kinase [Acidobacteriota bacterium]